MNAILERWHIKLGNWALWKMGSQGYGGVSSAYDGLFGDGAPRPPLPLVGEALDTDDLILKLSPEHRQAVAVVYVWSVPETLAARARIIGIHRDTLSDRVRSAKLRLDDMDCARRRAMRKVTEGMRAAA